MMCAQSDLVASGAPEEVYEKVSKAEMQNVLRFLKENIPQYFMYSYETNVDQRLQLDANTGRLSS